MEIKKYKKYENIRQNFKNKTKNILIKLKKLKENNKLKIMRNKN